MPPKVTFHLAKTCFPKNPSFRREEIYIQSFYSELFFLPLENIVEIREDSFRRKTFSCLWKPFSSIFLPEEAVFLYNGNLFFNECSILRSGNGFLASADHLWYSFPETPSSESLTPSVGKTFLNKFFILAIGEGFFLLWKSSTLLLY